MTTADSKPPAAAADPEVASTAAANAAPETGEAQTALSPEALAALPKTPGEGPASKAALNRMAEARRVERKQRPPVIADDVQAAIDAAVAEVQNRSAVQIAILKTVNRLGLTEEDALFAEHATSPEEAVAILERLYDRYTTLASRLTPEIEKHLRATFPGTNAGAAAPPVQTEPPRVPTPQVARESARPKTWDEWKEFGARGGWNVKDSGAG